MGKLGAIIFLLLFSAQLAAQQVRVSGYFMQDSAQLGERVGFVLKASYPQASQLIFPDSTHDFSPFVLLEKKTFISATTEGITQDSAVYYLSNFSLEPSSYLSLPVFELNRYDSISYFTPAAELALQLSLDSIPEELMFQENNVYQPLEKPFNWFVFSTIIGGVLLGLGLIYFLFADRIKRLFRKNREKLRWIQFDRKWKKLADQLHKDPKQELADEVVGLWKGYLESLTSQPFQEWTSSEIAEALDDKEVFKALRSIDMIIYAGVEGETNVATAYLLEVAKSKYHTFLNQLNHERVTR